MVRVLIEIDEASDFLAIFYKYIVDRCHPKAFDKLQQVLATLEELATSNKFTKLKKRILQQFKEDAVLCSI